MSDRLELLARGESRRALRRARQSHHHLELERLGRLARPLTLPSVSPSRSRSLVRSVGHFLSAPFPVKKAQIKGAVRRRLLEIGAIDAAQPGLSLARRLQLLIDHLHGPRPRTADDLGPVEAPPPAINRTIAPGVDWSGPLVSVVVHASIARSSDGADLLERISAQTLKRLEVVVWDPETREAWHPDSVDERWLVEPEATLASTLLGRYAWVATLAANEVPPAFLELNVMALEGEQLDVAVNAFGTSEVGEQALRDGLMPGKRPHEVVLTTGDASFLGDDLTWVDVAAGARSRVPDLIAAWVTGRLLTHRMAAPVATPVEWTGNLDTLAGPSTNPESSRRTVVSGPLILSLPPGRAVASVLHRLRELDAGAASSAFSPRRDHVLVLFPYLAVGGAEIQTLDVLKRLRPRFDFFVATTEPLTASLGSMVADYLELTPHVFCLPEIIDRHLFFSAISRLMTLNQIGTVFVANGSNWIYDAVPSLKARFPGLHLVDQVFDHRMGWIQRYDPEIVRAFDHHIAPNPRIIEAYQRKGVASGKISLVYPAIDTTRYAPETVPSSRIAELREQLRLPEGRPVVVMAGRLHPQKRPFDFLALASRVRPEEATFLLVGDGPLASRLDAQLSSMALPHLRRLPFHRPAAEILALADVVMILSEYEGLPLVLLESQSLGTPVVATDVGAIREALEWTGGGAVVPVGDLGAAERALRDILSSPPEMSRARKRVRERFDVGISARGHAGAFEA